MTPTMKEQPMSDTPKAEVQITPEMVKAASEVKWIDDYRFEFGLDEEDDDDRVAERLKELLAALATAGLRFYVEPSPCSAPPAA